MKMEGYIEILGMKVNMSMYINMQWEMRCDFAWTNEFHLGLVEETSHDNQCCCVSPSDSEKI